MPTDPRSAAAVGRLYQALRASLEGRGGVAGEVTVSEIYQTLVPYARARSELGFEMNADYEHALMRLIAGEGGFARLEPPEARAQVTRELESSNPDVTIYRRFAASTVRLSQSAAPATPATPASAAVRGTSGVRETPSVRETPAVRGTPAVREAPYAPASQSAPASPGASTSHAPATRAAPAAAPASDVGPKAGSVEGAAERAAFMEGAAAKQASVEGAAPNAPSVEPPPGERRADAATRYVAVPGADRIARDAAETGSGSRREGPEGGADSTSESASWRQALERVAAPLPGPRDTDEALAARSERALDDGLARLSSLLDVPAHTDRTAEDATEWSGTRDAGQPQAASPGHGVAAEAASPGVGETSGAASPGLGEASGAASRRPDACGSCGKTLPTDRDARFCPYCGSEQPDVCADCGDDMEPDWRYCPSCGTEA